MPVRPHSFARTAEDRRPARRQRVRGERHPSGRPARPATAAGLRRLQWFVVALLLVTWLPDLLGAAAGVASLRAWSVASGYAGLSWALPGLLTGVVVGRRARAFALPAPRLAGVAAGLAAGALLLVAAATIVGA